MIEAQKADLSSQQAKVAQQTNHLEEQTRQGTPCMTGCHMFAHTRSFKALAKSYAPLADPAAVMHALHHMPALSHSSRISLLWMYK